MSTKIKTTVMDALNRSIKQYDDTLMAAAHKINDDVSLRVLRAEANLTSVGYDDENEWSLAVDEWDAALKAFLDRHEFTVVEL